MSRKVAEYCLEIEDGYPPNREKTSYTTKANSATLIDIAERIKPGQHVKNVSAGSLGKLGKLIESRGWRVVTRRAQGDTRGTLYVVTEQWLKMNPSKS